MNIQKLLLLLAISSLCTAEDYFPKPDDKGGWRTLKDSAKIRKLTGLELTKLDEAFAYVEKTTQHGGLLVVRHGQLVYEKYFGRGNREALPPKLCKAQASPGAFSGTFVGTGLAVVYKLNSCS